MTGRMESMRVGGLLEESFELPRGDQSYDQMNEDIRSFEIQIKTFLESNRPCLALNSGTAAIHLALKLSGVQQGDYVLCQSHTFVACINAIKYQGAIPVLIDSEKDTWNISLQYVQEAVLQLNKKKIYPKALIAACLYGVPYGFDAVYAFAKANNIKVIDDSAEALGSTFHHKKCGTLGDFGVLSFNYNKIITTGGGGILVCQDQKDYLQALKLATQAKENKPHYQHEVIGYNYRMSHINAKIGRSQMHVLEKNISSRQDLNSWYRSLFHTIDGVKVQQTSSSYYTSNCWLTAILIDPSKTGGITREDLRLALEADNIESRPLWKPMHLQPLCKDFPFYGTNVCETLFENGLCLPSGSNLTDQDRNRIKKSILKVFKK